MAPEDSTAFAFGVRLLATVALTFALIGVAGYLMLERTLAHRQIADYAATQRGDAKAIEREAAQAASPSDAIVEIHRLLDGVAQREGTIEAQLIDQRHVIRAASHPALEGHTDFDPRIAAALEHGRSFSGRESDRRKDLRNFEFVTPVNLPGGRYAYDVVFDHRVYDSQLHEVRLILGLIGLLALIAGAAVFYLVGGRRLMRDHRRVLRRATRDGLTDLPNQRAFEEELPDAVAAAMRYGDPLALMLLDVDDFKLINDRHGHPQGDTILRVIAGVLRSSRPGDRPYRVGGDEFALLLAHTDAEGARTRGAAPVAPLRRSGGGGQHGRQRAAARRGGGDAARRGGRLAV